MKSKPRGVLTKDLGKVGCRLGGNHHHWSLGRCENCGVLRRKFDEERRLYHNLHQREKFQQEKLARKV